MAPPKRASSVSTKIIGFRLTEEETRRLDQLVKELGHKDRSSLLRAWLAQSGPIPRTAEDASSHSARPKTKKVPTNAQQPAGEIETAHSNRDKQAAPSNKAMVDDLIEKLEIIITREKDPRTGLSPMPNVMRVLLPHFTRAQMVVILDILCVAGKLQLYTGGAKQLSSKDRALCPIDPEGNVCTGVRWIGING